MLYPMMGSARDGFRPSKKLIGFECFVSRKYSNKLTSSSSSSSPVISTAQGSFRGGMHGNAVAIVEMLPERIGTASPLLKCEGTHYRRYCQPIPGQKCTVAGFCIFSLKNFPGVITRDPAERSPRCLDPDTNFRLNRQRSHCSCFTKRPLRWRLRQRKCARIKTVHPLKQQ